MRVNAKLGDKAKVVVYGSSQLGGDFEMMKKLKLGTIDLVQPSTVMSSYVPSFGLFEMPYLVKDREHMARIRDQIVFPTMVPQAEKVGYHIIGIWENGFRQITNNKRPIVKPEDLQGIKLRVPKGVWRVKMFKAYGANPTPLGFSEVFVALQTGAMDGQENPLAQIVSGHFQEVQKYLSMTGHVYTPTYVVAGASWARLRPDVQKILPTPPRRCSRSRSRWRPISMPSCSPRSRRPEHQDQRSRQGRLHQGEQADLRGVRQGSSGRQGDDRQGSRARPQVVVIATSPLRPAHPGRPFASASRSGDFH